MQGSDAPPVVVTVDLGGLPVDVALIDALARLQLVVGRRGGRVRLAQGGPDLGALLRLCGLDDALPEAGAV